MHRIILGVIAAIGISAIVATTALSEDSPSSALAASTRSAVTTTAVPNPTTDRPRTPPSCRVQHFRPFSAMVWDKRKWERGQPPARILKAEAERLGCAPPAHRQAMKRVWRRDAAEFYGYRTYRGNNPWYGCTTYSGCQFYALPAPIVECESGGRFNDPSAPNGGYSMLDMIHQGVGTWEDWRPAWASGYASPWEAPRRAQDEAALHGWSMYGSSPWECKA